ncbi:MAG: glycosyltransferase [Sphingomonadaceae bacterium]|nr:glycosyltransferase [Sphingomonadaceae bacterium]
MSAPLRILHVVPSYFPAVRYGGPIFSVHGLAKAQAALGHRVDVFTTNADGPQRLPVPTDRFVDVDGVQVRYFPLGIGTRLFRAPAMAAYARAHIGTYDIVHIHAIFLWPVMRMARIAKAAGVPYLLSPRGMLVRELFRARSGLIKRLWMRLFDRKTIEQAAMLVVTAGEEARALSEFPYRVARLATIPNGVDLPVDDGEAAVDPSTLPPPDYFLSLGRINWKKNLPALVEAMAGVTDARLVIVGNDEDGDGAAVRAAIDAHRLAARVTLIDRAVEGAEKAALYRRCRAFILPSLSENFGNVVVEAMAAERPVIVTDRCGVAEHVAASGGGLVSPPDSGALRAAICQMHGLTDSARQAMGDAGRAYVGAHLTWPAVARAMVNAYRQTMDG